MITNALKAALALILISASSVQAMSVVTITPSRLVRLDSQGSVSTTSTLVAWLAREYRVLAQFNISPYQGCVVYSATLSFKAAPFSSNGNVVNADQIPSSLQISLSDFNSSPLAQVARGLSNQVTSSVDVTSILSGALAQSNTAIQFRWWDSDTVPSHCGYTLSNIKLDIVLATTTGSDTIAGIKTEPDGTSVECPGVVSAMLGSCYYIEEPARNAGIRVDSPDTGRSPGERVWVHGTMGTLQSGERYITNNPLTGHAGYSGVIKPFYMNYEALGGTDFGLPPNGQIGVTDGVGLNNVGLLVRSAGLVTESGANWMKITDGSGSKLKVLGTLPAQPGLVTVTGISSIEDAVTASDVPASYYVTDLGASLAAAGSSQATLHIAGHVAVSANTTIPENITLSFARGGVLEVPFGMTLTINGDIDAGLYQIFGGAGTVTGDPKVEAVYPEWFHSGAYDSESSDWSTAINKAILLANGGCIKVKLQSRRYNVLSTINLGCQPSSKADMTLEGSVRSTGYERGTILVGNTGEGKCVIETTDTDGVHLKNLGVVRGSLNPSSVGILQARGTTTGWAGDQYHENIYVNMSSNPTSNNGIGTIGIINLAGEETRWHNLQVWANLPLVISSNRSFARTTGDLAGTQTCAVSSSIGATLDPGASNSVFRLSGLGRLIAYDYVSPCVLINSAETVDLGDASMCMRTSGIGGITPGAYKYAIENWNCYQFSHYGAVEGAGGYLMNRGDLTDAEVNVSVAAVGETSLPVIYLFDDGAVASISGSSFSLACGDTSRPLVQSRRMDNNNSEPMLFTVQDCEVKTNLACNATTFTDSRILRNTKNCAFNFGDGKSIAMGSQKMVIPVSKNIGVRGQTTDLFRIHMPTYISNLGAFSCSVCIDGSVTNAVDSAMVSPSVGSFKCKFNVANKHNAQSIAVSSISTTNDSSASSDSSANLVVGVIITAVADNANNWVTISAQPSTEGSNNAEVFLRGKAEFVWSGGYRDTILIENL